MPPNQQGDETMRRVQKQVVAAGVAVAAVMLLFPPFHIKLSQGVAWKLGYAFLFDPPRRALVEASVDVERLGLQWLAVAAVTGLLVWLSGRR
jgi:hypothetical protein